MRDPAAASVRNRGNTTPEPWNQDPEARPSTRTPRTIRSPDTTMVPDAPNTTATRPAEPIAVTEQRVGTIAAMMTADAPARMTEITRTLLDRTAMVPRSSEMIPAIMEVKMVTLVDRNRTLSMALSVATEVTDDLMTNTGVRLATVGPRVREA